MRIVESASQRRMGLPKCDEERDWEWATRASSGEVWVGSVISVRRKECVGCWRDRLLELSVVGLYWHR